ncbi:hypothetical protein [Streptomyces sp. L2]|uniref:hypothetical protein n=1 Tax=Streptomyces sp. L2 TaxID=2162665 RepID=UPI00101366D1|nr:hypothetical protein [Streptomyces sp. L2]
MRRSKHAVACGGVLAATALAALSVTPAHAADSGDRIAGYQSARKVLQTEKVKETVSRFLAADKRAKTMGAADGGAQGGGPAQNRETTGTAPIFDLKRLVPIYEISPQFVEGETKSARQEPLRLSFLASRVTADDGQKASVLLSPTGRSENAGGPSAGSGGWQLSGIRDGDREITLAERGNPHTRTFTEPQINAWYQLTDSGMVEPLNNEARAGLRGRTRLPLSEYQKLVNKRYGDKLPGSEYDHKGLAGGYADLTEEGGTDHTRTLEATPHTDELWRSAVSAGAVGLMTVGGVMYVRRRRASADR